jgi:hypothetical protein
VGQQGSVFEEAQFGAGVVFHEALRVFYRGRLRFEAPADQGPVRPPRPEVGDPEVELARDEGGDEVPRSRLVTRAVVILDQLSGYEVRVVVRHDLEEVA